MQKRVGSILLQNGKSLDFLRQRRKSKWADDLTADCPQISRLDQGDQTSGSDSDISETSEDENKQIIENSDIKQEVILKEEDFFVNEKLKFSSDVYNFTICANMTKCCSPLQQGWALNQCCIVFGV